MDLIEMELVQSPALLRGHSSLLINLPTLFLADVSAEPASWEIRKARNHAKKKIWIDHELQVVLSLVKFVAPSFA